MLVVTPEIAKIVTITTKTDSAIRIKTTTTKEEKVEEEPTMTMVTITTETDHNHNNDGKTAKTTGTEEMTTATEIDEMIMKETTEAGMTATARETPTLHLTEGTTDVLQNTLQLNLQIFKNLNWEF